MNDFSAIPFIVFSITAVIMFGFIMWSIYKEGTKRTSHKFQKVEDKHD